MGGDGLGGLAMAIFGATIAFVVGGFLLAFLLGRWLGKYLGWSTGRRTSAALLLGFVGLCAGALAVFATFYEATWAPPPELRLNVPGGFAHRDVFILEDSGSAKDIAWMGREMPFFGKHATIDVTTSGIVRVRNLGAIAGRGDARVLWNDSSESSSVGGGPAPVSTGAGQYIVVLRPAMPADENAGPPLHDFEALGAYIMKRESGAR